MLPIFVCQADLVVPAMCESFVVFVANSSVLRHPRGTALAEDVVFCRYTVERVDEFWSLATL